MGEFFQPWRRRMGIVTLVISCLFAAGWVRSLYVDDRYEVGECVFMSIEADLCQVKRVTTFDGRQASAAYQPVWIAPYWSIVLPLTLLSTLLLLSKPRKKVGPIPPTSEEASG